ncbi:MAG: hypothetical protein FWG82_03615 [Oscillospiraceae bacterium]|nr:hypothetical protein [Oscillospiraceae bacterium]
MKRLLKNEIKSTAQSMMGIYLATVITLAVMLLAQLANINWLTGVSYIALLIVGFLVFFVTMITVIRNFKLSLYGNEGYLSYALPVKGGTLLGAKTIVSAMWMLISFVLWIGVWVGSTAFLMSRLEEEEMTILEAIKELLPMLVDIPGTGVLVLSVSFIASYIFLLMLVFVAVIFFAITVAQTRYFLSGSTIWSILLSFIIFLPAFVVNVYLTNNAPLTFVITAGGVGFIPHSMQDARERVFDYIETATWNFPFGVAGMIFMLLMSAGLFIASAWLMNNRTNVK